MNLLLTCGVVVTGIVIYMSTMLSLIYMFRLIILNLVIDLRLSSPAARSSPSDAGALIIAPEARGQGYARSPERVAKLPDSPAFFEPQAPEVRRDTARAERATAELPTLDHERGGDSLQQRDGLDDALTILHRSPGELFPANRVTMRCSRCGHYVSRGEGYRHVNVGDKKTFCEACHEAMGLPVRSL
jgi:hypothetical protein